MEGGEQILALADVFDKEGRIHGAQGEQGIVAPRLGGSAKRTGFAMGVPPYRRALAVKWCIIDSLQIPGDRVQAELSGVQEGLTIDRRERPR